jgi:hypothetical protein
MTAIRTVVPALAGSLVSLLSFSLAGAAVPARTDASQPPIDFNRQVLPILSDNCFACHGPDAKKRKARLRLDTKQGAFAELRSGGFAIVAGKPDDSALVDRINSDNPRQLMPPPSSHKRLTAAQKELLRQWIAQGAKWSSHWAYAPPRRPPLPRVSSSRWERTPIDRFILARLDAEGLEPSPEADRITLLRRVTLDLTGLPPTLAEVDAFLADTSPSAYEKAVDHLLESSRFGEHMTRTWLDAARYGDTHGLHLDNYREIWPYRDWVIRAFNRNQPFDQFLVEQLAGDLLPEATLEQVVATGFNRCHVTTSEGGSIEEEVYVRNVVDRVDTFGTVFLGLTTGCARCHDHKYDPITQKEYYQLFAFFNSIDGPALDGNAARYPPFVQVATPEQKAALKQLNQKAGDVRRQILEAVARVKYDDRADARAPEKRERTEYVWIDDDLPTGAKPAAPGGPNVAWHWVGKPKHPVFSGKRAVAGTAKSLSQFVFEGAGPGLQVGSGDKLFAHVYLDPANPPREIMLQWNTGQWQHRAYWGDNAIPWGRDNSDERRRLGGLPQVGKWVRLEVEADRVGLRPGMVISGWAFTQQGGTVTWDRAGIVTATPQGKSTFDSLSAWIAAQKASNGVGLPSPLQEILKLPTAKRSAEQTRQLRDSFLEHAYAGTRPIFEPLHRRLEGIERERKQVEEKMPATLVFRERKEPRPAYLLKRGEYDQRGPRVERGTPRLLPPLDPKLPRDRLGLARWLVSPNHPLTARVAVNRFWQQCFGTGLVKTTEDFGSQGEPPSHPELLDWLAVQFREDGWNVKRFMKLLVMSAAYCQSSRVTPDRLARDPANRLLSRGPRFRLDAEMVRDQALFVSGLLVERAGGPSVKPPQPSGLWEAVGYTASNTARFTPDTGVEKTHRRSMYTFWKRTAPPPQMNAFDAPSRESCTVRRERTNTPLQALLLLNEEQMVECARALGERVLREGGKSVEERVAYLFRLAACRPPDAREKALLVAAYNEHLATYRQNPEAARKLITVGETKPDPRLDACELAAWTMMANIVLNLDEVLNKG